MKFLYGKNLAEELLAELTKKIATAGKTPGLAVILVGDDPASHTYVGLKEKAAERIGVHFERFSFPKDVTEEKIIDSIKVLNDDPAIHGIIVQLPLPEHLNESEVIRSIAPEKDVDGFHPNTLERYFNGDILAQPVFPRAVARLILSAGEDIHGQKGVAIVNSALFGDVMRKTLELLGLEPSIIERKEWDAKKELLKEAKVVVTACGEPGLVSGELLSPGVIVIDGGITRMEGKVFGDVDRASVTALSGSLAPVPGGVGPLTVASLLERVTEEALRRRGV